MIFRLLCTLSYFQFLFFYFCRLNCIFLSAWLSLITFLPLISFILSENSLTSTSLFARTLPIDSWRLLSENFMFSRSFCGGRFLYYSDMTIILWFTLRYIFGWWQRCSSIAFSLPTINLLFPSWRLVIEIGTIVSKSAFGWIVRPRIVHLFVYLFWL